MQNTLSAADQEDFQGFSYVADWAIKGTESAV